MGAVEGGRTTTFVGGAIIMAANDGSGSGGIGSNPGEEKKNLMANGKVWTYM